MHPTAEAGLPSNESQRRSGSTYYAASYQPPGGGSPGVAGGAGGSAGPGGVGGSGGGTGAPAGYRDAGYRDAGYRDAGYRDVHGGGTWAPPSTPAVSADPWVQHAVPASGYAAPAPVPAAAGAPRAPEFPPLPEFPAPPGAGPVAGGVSPQAGGFPPPIHEFPPPASGYPPPNGTNQQPAPPRPRRGKALPILLGVLAVVLVLFAGAGVFAYRTFFDGVSTSPGSDTAAGTTPTTAPTAQPSGANTSEEVTGDLGRYKKGDCLTVDDATNNVAPATCSDAGAYKVLLRKDGTIDDSVCETTEATMSLYEDADGTARDFVLCVGPV